MYIPYIVDVNMFVLHKNKSLLAFINVLLYCVKSTVSCICDNKPVKHETKIAADDILVFYFHLSKKIKLDVSRESSAQHQALFYQKNNEKLFKTVICCSRDWRFKS